MRKVIAAMLISVDGYIEGPDGTLDWVENWEDTFDLMREIDTCILGARMFPGYEQYWSAILADPQGVLPLTGKVPTKDEIAYARFAAETPHLVLSGTLDKVSFPSARIIRDVAEIRRMKQQPGRSMYAVGGAKLISSLINLGLVDEIRLIVCPILLAQGKSLFKELKERHMLTLLQAESTTSGRVSLAYGVS